MNQDAQIIKLTHASRAAFVTATASVTDPIMSVITGEAAIVFGVKIAGSYKYLTDESAAVAALQASVSTLSGQVNTILSAGTTGGTVPLGASAPPTGTAFSYPYPSDPSVQNPMLFQYCRPSPTSGTTPPDYFLDSRFHLDKKMWLVVLGGEPFYRLEWTGTTLRIGLYETYADASTDTSRLASASFTTAGIYPLISEADGKTVFGYYYLRDIWASISLTEVMCSVVVADLDNYYAPLDMWRAGARFEFSFRSYIEGGSAPSFTLTLSGTDNPNTGTTIFGSFTVPLIVHGGQAGYVNGKIIVEVLETDNAGDNYNLRSFLEIQKSDLGSSGDPIGEMEIQAPWEYHFSPSGLLGEQSFFLHMNADDGGGSAIVFDLLSSSGQYIPPAGGVL